MLRKFEESKLEIYTNIFLIMQFFPTTYAVELSDFLRTVKPVSKGSTMMLYFRSVAAVSATGTSGYGGSNRV